MMHGREKSDSAIVARSRRTKPGDRRRSRWSQGRGPRGTRTSKARAGRRTGKACHRRWNAYGKPQGNGRRNGSPRSSTISASTCSGWRSSRSRRDAAPGVDGLTWRDYEADLDRKLEDLHARVHRGAYRALPSRRRYIPKADGRQRPLAVAALEDKIVQRATARGAERDLRGRLPRVLVRVPTEAQPARCAGRAGGRDHQHQGELDPGRRHPIVLRRGQPGMAGPLRGASDRRSRASSA